MGACVIRGGLKVIVVQDALLSHFLSLSFYLFPSFSRLPSLLLHRCEQTVPFHQPLLSRNVNQIEMKNCRQHILNNHRSVSFRITRGRTREMCFPKSYQIKKPFEFQRVNKNQQPHSHLHCAQRTVRKHVPQAGLFSVTSASYQKNTMFRVPSWFTNMRKCIKTKQQGH